jgi:NAD(P)-dependent dehydrogenase (short-subunit alcohol dehydrogenase family)
MADKVCALVGIGDHLGLGLARRFAAGGYAVALIGRRPDRVEAHAQTLRGEGLEAHGFPADAADAASLAAAFAAIRERLGDPQVLIYNAAIVEQGAIATVDYGYFQHCFEANAGGALRAVQEVLPAMRKAGRGTILFSGGMLAFDPLPDWGILAAGKAALRSLAFSLDKELRGEGVHVATIAIYGSIQFDPFYAPERIADAFWTLHEQGPGEFQRELIFRNED